MFFCVDGLNGFKQVIDDQFPRSITQRCIVHMIRNSTRYVSYKDIRAVIADLRKVYSASNRDQAAIAMESFANKWDASYPEISKKWMQSWDELMAFMDYGGQIRRMIYTTNPVEALHRIMRKTTKAKGAWVSDNALIKQLYLSVIKNERYRKRKVANWLGVQKELIEKFGEGYERFI